MMRGGVLLLMCAATACNGGTGVDIDIHMPQGVDYDQVELFIAYDQCYEPACSGIAWPEQKAQPQGDVYYLKDERRIVAELDTDRAVLHLDAEAGYADPIAIAVVALRDNVAVAAKVLHDVRIPRNEVEIWNVFLDPVDPAQPALRVPPSDPARPHRALAWPRRPTPDVPDAASCVVTQTWNASAMEWETEYFVPYSDPDCDAHAIECNEYWFDYNAGSQASACFTSSANVAGACLLGQSFCADGQTSSDECRLATPMTCLPDKFCEKCSATVPPDGCVGGMLGAAITDQSMPSIECVMPSSTDLGRVPCANTSSHLVLPASSSACVGAKLHVLDRPFADPQSSLSFGTQEPMTIGVDILDQTLCKLDIKWLSGSAMNLTSGHVDVLLAVEYANATRAVFPMRVMVEGTTLCEPQTVVLSDCKLHGEQTDGVFSCAAHP